MPLSTTGPLRKTPSHVSKEFSKQAYMNHIRRKSNRPKVVPRGWPENEPSLKHSGWPENQSSLKTNFRECKSPVVGQQPVAKIDNTNGKNSGTQSAKSASENVVGNRSATNLSAQPSFNVPFNMHGSITSNGTSPLPVEESDAEQEPELKQNTDMNQESNQPVRSKFMEDLPEVAEQLVQGGERVNAPKKVDQPHLSNHRVDSPRQANGPIFEEDMEESEIENSNPFDHNYFPEDEGFSDTDYNQQIDDPDVDDKEPIERANNSGRAKKVWDKARRGLKNFMPNRRPKEFERPNRTQKSGRGYLQTSRRYSRPYGYMLPKEVYESKDRIALGFDFRPGDIVQTELIDLCGDQRIPIDGQDCIQVKHDVYLHKCRWAIVICVNDSHVEVLPLYTHNSKGIRHMNEEKQREYIGLKSVYEDGYINPSIHYRFLLMEPCNKTPHPWESYNRMQRPWEPLEKTVVNVTGSFNLPYGKDVKYCGRLTKDSMEDLMRLYFDLKLKACGMGQAVLDTLF
ncbi:hypothetical protein M501DRAFT_986376 [Patellaria atrata CBS 101060]|uniref:Uncharacterized protein n=1 Tax=Patellaria atrata CBS 101060 TaxID=1346257 RepID=A0A9P4VRI3_9PEZI|nr:hypothetical protein M501DRAFT_986376 [Patellaria atrata CBS 101060]